MSRVTSSTNAGEAHLYGGEARLRGNLNENLSAYASFNYTYGRIRTDSVDYPLDHTPPIFGKLGIRLSEEDFRAEFFCQ
jgi:hemoglobin/transferrin/lactoferrin receptor protein